MTIDLLGLTEVVEIGTGGFAVVYRARQKAHRRLVAVKVLDHPDLDEHALRRFDRERAALGQLSNHPGIVTLYDSGRLPDGRPYLVMEYMSGGDLAERLATGGPLPWQEATTIAIHLAGAVAAAHAVGILHRDVKPENVLRSGFGDWQLTDFGIAGRSGGNATTGELSVSLAHVSPDVFGEARPGVAADVYGLGSVLHTMLSGREPFAPSSREPMLATIHRIATQPVPDLRPSGVPDAIARVVEQAMSKDPRRRPATATEFGTRLNAACRVLAVDPAPPAVQPGVPPQPGTDSGSASLPAPARRSWRRPVAALGTAALVAAAITGIVRLPEIASPPGGPVAVAVSATGDGADESNPGDASPVAATVQSVEVQADSPPPPRSPRNDGDGDRDRDGGGRRDRSGADRSGRSEAGEA